MVYSVYISYNVKEILKEILKIVFRGHYRDCSHSSHLLNDTYMYLLLTQGVGTPICTVVIVKTGVKKF